MEHVYLIGAQPTFGLNRIEFLQSDLVGYPMWQYAASVAWIALALIVAPVMDFVMTRVLKKLTEKTDTDLDDKLLEILHKPVKAIVVLGMLNTGLHFFEWPAVVEKVLGTVFTIAVAITVIYVAVRLVDLLMDYFAAKAFVGDPALAGMMLPVLGRTFKVFVIIIGALTTAQVMGFPITSALAGLGVGGIAVALAAQSTLANVFGSITILTDRPFSVGDVVKIEAVEGKVESIGLRSTRIRTHDGHFVTIPNKTVADAAIINISRRPNIRQLITISLTYDTPAARVQEAVGYLREVFKAHPLTHDFIVNWRDFAPSSLDIFVVYWCKTTDLKEFLVALEEINLEIKQRFDAAKLEFAFPTQTIQLQTVPPKA
ncbi:MAG: mechanosensitive ion channel family protein [Verrucomicrobiota bacterium]